MDIKEHAELLRDFFTTLFEPDETVYIFPGLSEAKFEEFSENWETLPAQKYNKWLKFPEHGDGNRFEPRRFLDPYHRKASSTDVQVIKKLYDFADMGYDIFFCVNHLTCAKRCQKTVHTARHIVLEADGADIETQKAIFEDYKDYFAAMIFSGSRSIHAYAQLAPSIPNYGCVGWKKLQAIKKERQKTALPLPEYNAIAQFWINEMRERGLVLDTAVATDYARVSRVPGFKHSKTGKVAEVLFLNPKALGSQSLMHQRNWETNEEAITLVSDDFNDSNDSNDETIIESGFGLGEGIQGSLAGQDSLEDNIDIKVSKVSPVDPTMIANKVSSIALESTQELNQQSQYKGAPKTNVQHNQHFLDHFKVFQALKRDGITQRGIRKSCHVALFVAGRIFGWDKARLAAEWKAIVSLKPENIGLTPDKAVDELLAHYDSKQNNSKISLPNALSLPQDPTPRLNEILSNLKQFNCPKPKDVATIIIKVLWQPIRELPVQCERGTVGIQTRALCKVCSRGQYKPAWNWLMAQNMVGLIDPSYISGRRTRRYSINIPLILCLMGFCAEELDWSEGKGWLVQGEPVEQVLQLAS